MRRSEGPQRAETLAESEVVARVFQNERAGRLREAGDFGAAAEIYLATLREAGDFGAAAEIYLATLRALPGKRGPAARRLAGRSHADLAQVFLELGQPARAAEHATAALQEEPHNSEVLFRRALAHQRQRQYEQASDDATAAHRLEPHNEEVRRLQLELIVQARQSLVTIRTAHLLSLSALRHSRLPEHMLARIWSYLHCDQQVTVFTRKAGRATMHTVSMQTGQVASTADEDVVQANRTIISPPSQACALKTMYDGHAVPDGTLRCHQDSDGYRLIAMLEDGASFFADEDGARPEPLDTGAAPAAWIAQHGRSSSSALMGFSPSIQATGHQPDGVLASSDGKCVSFEAGAVAMSQQGWLAMAVAGTSLNQDPSSSIFVFNAITGERIERIEVETKEGDWLPTQVKVHAEGNLLIVVSEGVTVGEYWPSDQKIDVYRILSDPEDVGFGRSGKVSCLTVPCQGYDNPFLVDPVKYVAPVKCWAVEAGSMAIGFSIPDEVARVKVYHLTTARGLDEEPHSVLPGDFDGIAFSGRCLITAQNLPAQVLVQVWSLSTLSPFPLPGNMPHLSERPACVMQCTLAGVVDRFLDLMFAGPSTWSLSPRAPSPAPDDPVVVPVYTGEPGEEPAAAVDAATASEVADAMWASRIEEATAASWAAAAAPAVPSAMHERAAASGASSASDRGQHPRGRLILLSFSRCPQEFLDALIGSDLGQALQARGVEIRPSWAKGGLVLAEDVDSGSVREEREHGAWHVAVRQADEDSVFKALHTLPCRRRPRLKQGEGRFEVPEDRSLFQDSDSDDEIRHVENDADYWQEIFLIKRTFIHIPPDPMGSVSQGAYTV